MIDNQVNQDNPLQIISLLAEFKTDREISSDDGDKLSNEIVNLVGMTVIMPTKAFHYRHDNRSFRQWVTIIAESHLIIKQNITDNILLFDLASCKSFDVDGLLNYLSISFGNPIGKVYYIPRKIEEIEHAVKRNS